MATLQEVRVWGLLQCFRAPLGMSMEALGGLKVDSQGLRPVLGDVGCVGDELLLMRRRGTLSLHVSNSQVSGQTAGSKCLVTNFRRRKNHGIVSDGVNLLYLPGPHSNECQLS